MHATSQHQHGGNPVRQPAVLAGVAPQERELSVTHSAGTAPPEAVRALLTDEQAAAFLGVSKRTFLTLRSTADWMPSAIVLGPRLLRWSSDELRAAVAHMPRQLERVQPEGLVRAKIERLKATGSAQ